jgi:TolA-binding protein
MKKILLILFFFAMPVVLRAQNGSDNDLAMQYYEEGDYQKAAVLMGKIFNQTKDDTHFELYFNALLKSKQYDEAEKVIKKLIRQYPGESKYEIALGRIYKEKGRQEDAAKTFGHIIDNMPADEGKIRELATYFYQMDEFDLSINAFMQGRKVLKNEQLFTYELLSLYRFKKDKNMLVQEYLNALPAAPQLLQQAETVLSSVFDANEDYLLLQAPLLKKIQKDPQNETFAKLLIWQYLQQEDYDMALRQLIAQDKRTKDNGTVLFENAQTFVANKAYDAAIKAFTYLLTKGTENEYYLPSRLGLIDARYQLLLTGKNDKGEVMLLAGQYQAILDEYGQNARTLFALRKLATIQAYYLHNLVKAEEALTSGLKIPGIPKNETGELKLELGDIYVLTDQPWDAILLYEQVSKEFENQNLGNEARYRSARLSFYQGNFSYAKSQADILKASTAQLIANDAMNLSLLLSDHLENRTDTLALKMYAAAELLQFKNLSLQALQKFDSITVSYPQHTLADDILMARSKIYIKNNDFSAAAELLTRLVTHPQNNIWTDDALFILAGLYGEQLKDPAQAKILYQKLITDFPGSMYITEARKQFRKLRGDNIGT